MTDKELRDHFGLSKRALSRLRNAGRFPSKAPLVNKTGSRLVHAYFDQRAGLQPARLLPQQYGEEHLD